VIGTFSIDVETIIYLFIWDYWHLFSGVSIVLLFIVVGQVGSVVCLNVVLKCIYLMHD
jgi:hypothetical protein